MEKVKNIPALRFPEFEGEWIDSRFGNYISERSERAKVSFPLYSLTIEQGIVPKTERYERSFLVSNQKEAYKSMYFNDFAFNPMNLRFGALARHKEERPVAVSKYYNVFYCNQIGNSVFFENYLTSSRLIRYYNLMATGSLIEKKRVHFSDFINFTKPLPSLPEQTRIASFLTAVDEKLTQLKKKKTLLEQYKKGVMQQLFSQQLRFKQDDGSEFPEWEEKRLGDCLAYEQPTKYLVSSTEYNNSFKTPVLTAGKTFILGYTDETNGIFSENLPVIIFDDFTTATQFVTFPFKAKSSAMKILLPKEKVNIKFVFEGLQLINYELGGHERHWISKFSQMEISIPSYNEQTKIANFLSAIDEKISHCQLQIEKMELWKKGLLQRMFI